MPANRLAKRNAAQERLKGGFLHTLGPQIRELAALIAEGTDEGRDSAAAALDRIAQTAGALGIEPVARAASEALSLEASWDERRLDELARVTRRTVVRPLFGPIGIVGDKELIGRFRKLQKETPEPLRIASDLSALQNPLSVVPWSVLLVPVDQVEAGMDMADGAPVLAWGESSDWAARLRCVEAGASGFLPRKAAAVDLLDRVRCHTNQPTRPPEVFVLAEQDERRQAVIDSLEKAGACVVASDRPQEISPALDLVSPDALVVGSKVGDVEAAVLVQAVRTHSRRSHIPVIVMGDELSHEALLEAGADDVVGSTLGAEQLALRILRRYQRMLTIRRGRHPISGLLDRPAALRALSRRMGNANRDNLPMSVAVLLLEGLGDARDRWGKAASNAGQELCAQGLEASVRRIDLTGQVGPEQFLVALHHCGSIEAERRLADLARRVEVRLHGDHRLKDVRCLFGVADTEAGVPTVALRAERALQTARRSPSK